MASLDTFVGKYIRLTEDLHEMRSYLNDIRICFIALTVSCYVAIILYAVILCTRRRGGGDGDEYGLMSRSNTNPRFNTNRTNMPSTGGAGAGGPRRSQSRPFDDVETGTLTAGGGNGGGTNGNNEWDDMMPPPPNGSAVKTIDGYRYRNPPTSGGTAGAGGGGRQKAGALFQPHTNRLSVNLENHSATYDSAKRQSLLVDNHTATSTTSTAIPVGNVLGRRSPSEHHQTFRDGFIEKSPSVS